MPDSVRHPEQHPTACSPWKWRTPPATTDGVQPKSVPLAGAVGIRQASELAGEQLGLPGVAPTRGVRRAPTGVFSSRFGAGAPAAVAVAPAKQAQPLDGWAKTVAELPSGDPARLPLLRPAGAPGLAYDELQALLRRPPAEGLPERLPAPRLKRPRQLAEGDLTAVEPVLGGEPMAVWEPPRRGRSRDYADSDVGRVVEQHRAAPVGTVEGDAASRRRQWAAMTWLHRFSSLERVRKCRRVSLGGNVTLKHRSADGRAHYSGLTTCGSIWSCPCCSARIWAERGDELAEAVERWYRSGGRVVLVTLTMRHRRDHDLKTLWSALGRGWKAARGESSGARRARERADVAGYARAVEATWGQRHGWHLHVHALIFANGDDQALAELGPAMFASWAAAIRGRDAEMEPVAGSGGYDAKVLDLADARQEAARYLAKGIYGETAKGTARSAGAELTAAGKRARGGINMTPFQLLERAQAGTATKVELDAWHEWEQTSKGKRALTWAPGFRQRLLADDERSDEEIAADTDQLGEPVAALPAETWRELREIRDGPCWLLEQVEQADADQRFEACARALARLGLGPPERPGPAPPRERKVSRVRPAPGAELGRMSKLIDQQEDAQRSAPAGT